MDKKDIVERLTIRVGNVTGVPMFDECSEAIAEIRNLRERVQELEADKKALHTMRERLSAKYNERVRELESSFDQMHKAFIAKGVEMAHLQALVRELEAAADAVIEWAQELSIVRFDASPMEQLRAARRGEGFGEEKCDDA